MIDKKEQRAVRANYFLLVLGILLSGTLVMVSRGGFAWLGGMSWGDISWLEWLLIVLILIVATIAQYYMLLLLRYSKLKYLVLIGIPVIWLFNNGIIAMSRFLDWTTDIGTTIGWLSIADLISWLAGIVYLPILLGAGAVTAILDASAATLSQSCYYAKLAMEITDVSAWQIIDFSMNILSIFWDLISNSFTQEVVKHTSNTESIFEFSIAAAVSLPQWLFSIGYSIFCLCL